jgi:hypothetical protein
MLGVLYHSSLWEGMGGNYDEYVWDSFILPSAQDITEVRWYGGFDPVYSGSGGPVTNFQVGFYRSNLPGLQPDLSVPPLAEYLTGGNAGQTLVGTYGGKAIYRYSFTLPAAFHAVSGVKYWLQVEAFQHGTPDWCIAAGTGGDGWHFHRQGDAFFQTAGGDAAFSLVANPIQTYVAYLPVVER